ncbi:uncharacterized protein PHALS_02816 [Plasmopara halstedii]|uniref:Uncharacterized protein n=1 Tax=Plasmopara halstedii TaxID=4781 RepID=A0A0P1AVK8_PLAHL|nr:uncharacterized protein PHALS_02816 [Plasmopara halstedii]CEG46413.1 hypothetical protein PHALS_02816 [Plasmopara halstedii]|eukprot:XP_024582782.1 hypothetical protein PHALS_02816 [Plasmopara halstedii]
MRRFSNAYFIPQAAVTPSPPTFWPQGRLVFSAQLLPFHACRTQAAVSCLCPRDKVGSRWIDVVAHVSQPNSVGHEPISLISYPSASSSEVSRCGFQFPVAVLP